MDMFDGYGSYDQEIDFNQFAVPPLADEVAGDLQHCITLIGTSDYSLEVEMSGYVWVEREVSQAEAFLARLYENG
jgi:hypothetical protein